MEFVIALGSYLLVAGLVLLASCLAWAIGVRFALLTTVVVAADDDVD